jgi:hypothetical protein
MKETYRKNLYLAMHWADFHFMLENFDLAIDLYQRIQKAAKAEKDDAAFIRATVAEAQVRHARKEPDRSEETPRLYALAMAYPKAPATPYLLWHCSVITRGDPMHWDGIFDVIIKKYPRSRHTLEARYNQVIRHPWRFHDERFAMVEQFKRDYPNEKAYHEYLDRWHYSTIEYMKDREERRARALMERKMKNASP